LKWIQKGYPWKSTVFILIGERKETPLSAGKFMITFFWDCEEIILMAAMPKAETVNTEVYIRMLTELGGVSNNFDLTGI
jgi:hypothetical protein